VKITTSEDADPYAFEKNTKDVGEIAASSGLTVQEDLKHCSVSIKTGWKEV
jgi:hypothetical protein